MSSTRRGLCEMTYMVWRIAVIALAGVIGIVHVVAFKGPAASGAVDVWILLVSGLIGYVLSVLAVWIVVLIAGIVGTPRERVPVSWNGGILKEMRCGDPLPAIHLVAWASVVNMVTSLVAYYLLYHSLSLMAMFMLPPSLGILTGTWLCNWSRRRDRGKRSSN